MIFGIIGKEGSGKKTFVRWLLGYLPQAKGNEPLEIVVECPDRRLEVISRITKATKRTYQRFTFLLPAANQKISGQLNQLRNCDGFVVITRSFGPKDTRPNLIPDISEIQDEMLIADLAVAEKRLAGLQMDKKKGKPINEKELYLLEKAKTMLDKGIFLKDDPELIGPTELKGYRFLTQKPVMLLSNEDQDSLPEEIRELPFVDDFISIKLALELELMELDEGEREQFRDIYGIKAETKELFLARLFDLLRFKTFFTFVSNEAKAWGVPMHYTCVECAGVIHSDMKKGFIKAEVVGYQDLERYGDIQACRKAGVLRLEGKDYMVKEGDLITFRFNV